MDEDVAVIPRGRRGASRSSIALGAAVGLVAIALAWVGAGVHGSAVEREAALRTELHAVRDDLQTRLAAADVQIAQLRTAFTESESRLRKAESAVAERDAKEAALRAERDALAASPSKFLQSLEVGISARGFFNSYSRARFAKLRNTSRFNLAGMQGIVEYRRADGSLVGSAPIQIAGTLLAGQTAVLDATGGEVTGGCDPKQSRVIVERVTVLDGSDAFQAKDKAMRAIQKATESAGKAVNCDPATDPLCGKL